MSCPSIQEPLADDQAGRVDASVTEDGGWTITAVVGGRTIAVRHYHDWHRVERARTWLKSELLAEARRLVTVGAALALLVGVPATASAQNQAGAGQGTTAGPSPEPEGFLSEPHFLTRAINFLPRSFRGKVGDGSGMKDKFYPEFSNMPTGAGWITAGPGYRHWLAADRVYVDASAAVSWRQYKMAQARFELPKLAHSRLAVGSHVRWQDLTQVTFFGEGADAPEADRAEYRLQSTNVVGYATVRPRRWLSVGGQFGWLDRPSIHSPTGSFQRGNPDARVMFPNDIVYSLPEQPSFLHGEASIAADTRDYRSHPSGGGLYRAAWARYADRDTGVFTFHRYEAEGAHFVPVAASRIVFALHGWLVTSDTADGDAVPFYLQPSLGGHNTVRAYTDYRFHDRNLLTLSAEGRVALFTHVDAAVFVDAGNVAPRVADLNLDKRAYGVGLRVHTRQSTFARFDVAHGDEGWNVLFRISDPFHLARVARRTAAIPFVP
jgi:surface antigen Omp85-like protein